MEEQYISASMKAYIPEVAFDHEFMSASKEAFPEDVSSVMFKNTRYTPTKEVKALAVEFIVKPYYTKSGRLGKPYHMLGRSAKQTRRARAYKEAELALDEKEKDLLSRFRTPQDAQKEQNLAPENKEGGSVAGGPTIG